MNFDINESWPEVDRGTREGRWLSERNQELFDIFDCADEGQISQDWNVTGMVLGGNDMSTVESVVAVAIRMCEYIIPASFLSADYKPSGTSDDELTELSSICSKSVSSFDDVSDSASFAICNGVQRR
jgi:hypothetical protein